MDVKEFLGIPYLLNGRDKNGVDCIGLVLLYLESLGVEVPEAEGLVFDENWREYSEARARAWLEQYTDRVEEPAAGDIVLILLRRGGIHLGVMTDKVNVLHVVNNRPSLLTPIRRIRRQVGGVFRIKSKVESRGSRKSKSGEVKKSQSGGG